VFKSRTESHDDAFFQNTRTSAFPRLFSAGVLLLFAAQSALPQVTGRVVDKSGNPVPFATITYANCANRLTWTYAGEDGRFTLPDPTKAPWKSGPIITGCLTAAPTSVSYPTANPAITKLDPLMEKGAFSFTLPENGNVFIALYGLSGPFFGKKRSSPVQKAVMPLTLFATLPPNTPRTFM